MGSFKTRDALRDAVQERAFAWRVTTDRQAHAAGMHMGCDVALQVVADNAETFRLAVQVDGAYTAHGREDTADAAMNEAETRAAQLAMAVIADRNMAALQAEQEREAEEREAGEFICACHLSADNGLSEGHPWGIQGCVGEGSGALPDAQEQFRDVQHRAAEVARSLGVEAEGLPYPAFSSADPRETLAKQDDLDGGDPHGLG